MPNVTVVIPAYNASAFIGDAVESVATQTYVNWQIIVVDDGSEDETWRALLPRRERLGYVYRQNGGPAAARNTGVRLANTPYVAFLDADDVWHSTKLAVQVAALDQNPHWGLVFSDAMTIDLQTQQRWHVQKERLGGWIFPRLLMNNFVPTSTVVARRACIEEAGLFDESPDVEGAEDHDLWLRVAANHEVGYLAQPLVDYRQRPGSHNKYFHRSCSAAIRVFEKNLMAHADKWGMDVGRVRRERLPQLHGAYAHLARQSGERSTARSHYWAAFKADPFRIRPLLGYLRSLL